MTVIQLKKILKDFQDYDKVVVSFTAKNGAGELFFEPAPNLAKETVDNLPCAVIMATCQVDR